MHRAPVVPVLWMSPCGHVGRLIGLKVCAAPRACRIPTLRPSEASPHPGVERTLRTAVAAANPEKSRFEDSLPRTAPAINEGDDSNRVLLKPSTERAFASAREGGPPGRVTIQPPGGIVWSSLLYRLENERRISWPRISLPAHGSQIRPVLPTSSTFLVRLARVRSGHAAPVHRAFIQNAYWIQPGSDRPT